MGKTRQVITGAAAILLLGYVHPVRAAEPSGGPSNAVSPDSPGAAESARDPRPLGITTAMTELPPVAADIRSTDESRPSVGLPEDLGSDRFARASKKKSKKSSVSKVKKKKREKKAAKKVTKKKQKTKKKRVSPH